MQSGPKVQIGQEEPLLLSVMEGKRAHLRPLVVVALGLGLRKRVQLTLRRGQVDFSRNARRFEPGSARDPEAGLSWKDPEDYIFTNPDTDKPFYDIKRSFHTACRLAAIKNLWWHDLRATFATRLALARYEALTIMTLMGHKDLKTTMRYIRASSFNATCGHFNLSTNEIRPPVMAAVNY